MANQPRAATLERVSKAVELRNSGGTWQQVADALDYRSANAAEASVRQYLRRMQANTDLGQMLMQEELKLQQRERYIMEAASKVPADDVQSRDTVDKARDRIATSRAKLWGLYAPERHQVAVAVTQTPAAIIQRTEAELLEAYASNQQKVIEG